MTSLRDEPAAGSVPEGFHRVHAERDPESNWAVDLDRLLEEYLAKICAGEIPDDEDGRTHVNFAEAALLLQGSAQVYSRKVEYLYSLVLHALEFISQQRQQNQDESTLVQPQESDLHEVPDEDEDPFWISDDVPVDPKNSLDISLEKDAPPNYFVKPPANLVVLEGDCLDTSDAAGELESYLLASSELFQDFILLDPCDAVTVNMFLKEDVGDGQSQGIKVKVSRKSFQSPTGRSGGGGHKSSAGKSWNNLVQSPAIGCKIGVRSCDVGLDPVAPDDFINSQNEFGMDNDDAGPADFGYEDNDDNDDNDDPWKPLNPHEPGNLKVKPFKRVKACRKPSINSLRKVSLVDEFPLARRHGTISPEFTYMWENQNTHEGQQGTQSPPLFEKLRQSLIDGICGTSNVFGSFDDMNGDQGHDDGVHDFDEVDADMPENVHVDEMDEDAPFPNKYGEDVHLETDEAFGDEVAVSNANLEDLCRSHLDALLTSIAESEKQTELAARVSMWKQKIEHNLEEQDSRPPFDIHGYSEKILEKLSVEADQRNAVSFADIVQGQEKHDVARTFSALLQLVNNGDVDLERSDVSESVCYTAVNPFHVRLIGNKTRERGIHLKKRMRSPVKHARKGSGNEPLREREQSPANSLSRPRSRVSLSQPRSKFPIKVAKVGGVRCTPDSKRRRSSRFVEPVDLHPAG
ncbi:hypothetical protein BT93_H2605 [Corymbia citriodora subsp. variegata]|nr:hypothetical protein BT93_H2605 [Corymbia citriodora subsp. variegata]